MPTPAAAIPDDFAQWKRDLESKLGDLAAYAFALPDDPGAGSLEYHIMPEAAYSVLLGHDLGRDPFVQVIVDGQQAEEYSVTYPDTGNTVLVGFDVPVAAVIRLL